VAFGGQEDRSLLGRNLVVDSTADDKGKGDNHHGPRPVLDLDELLRSLTGVGTHVTLLSVEDSLSNFANSELYDRKIEQSLLAKRIENQLGWQNFNL
jgi:hypothetical protein